MPSVSVLSWSSVSDECAFSTRGWDQLSQRCCVLLGQSCLRAQHDSETKVLEAALAPVMAKQVKYSEIWLNGVKCTSLPGYPLRYARIIPVPSRSSAFKSLR